MWDSLGPALPPTEMPKEQARQQWDTQCGHATRRRSPPAAALPSRTRPPGQEQAPSVSAIPGIAGTL